MHQLKMFVLVTALFLASASSTWAALGEAFFLPPHANYQKIKTSHFDIIYPGDYAPEARDTASYLEQAHATLAPYYGYEPSHRTTVILIDNEDSANGATSAVGLQGLILFMARPDPYLSIGEYEHWLKNLVIHEYAHYLTLEQTNGLFSILRVLFGNAIFPNHFWPSWLAEGLAVHAESTFTQQGRGYGALYSTLTRDGIYRQKLGQGDFLAYPKLMGPVPDYPFGEAEYYAGFGIVDEMLARYGKAAAGRYATRSSHRIPYFLDGGIEGLDGDKTQMGFRDLWESWIFRQSKRLKPELEWLKANGAPDPAFLTVEGIATRGSRLSPDAKRVAFALQSGHERSSVQVIDVETKNITEIDDAFAGVGLAWSLDGKKLYYSKSDFNGPFAFYSDLYVYDFERGSRTRVTQNERAKDPDLCGNSLAYVTQRGRYSEIRLIDLNSKQISTLYRAPSNHHVANPRCSRDGTIVYFTEHGLDPNDFLRSVSTDGKNLKQLTGSKSSSFAVLFPQPLSNGDVIFSRRKNGYYDLARFDSKSGKVELVRRSSGGYWLPSVDASEEKLAVTYISSTGVRTGIIDLPKKSSSISAKENTPTTEESLARVEAAPLPEFDSLKVQSTSYNLLTSLAPRIWAPHLLFTNDGGQYGFAITGWDDLDQFSYVLNAYYDARYLDRPAGSLSTRHRISTFQLGLFGESSEDGTFKLPSGARVVDEERSLGVILARPIPSAFWNFTPSLIGQWARTWRHTDTTERALRPEFRVGANLDFDSRDSFAHSITAEQGWKTSARGRRLFTGKEKAWKSLVSVQKLFQTIPRHGNLSVTGFGAWAPNPKASVTESDVRIGGQGEDVDLNPPLRGYRLGTFSAKRAAVAQLEYRVPVAEAFSGFGNWPIFFRNVGVFGFYDAAKFQETFNNRTSPLMSGAGGGLILNTNIGYQAPLQIRFEFAHGFNETRGGENIASVLLGY